jgi:hypothetical protein
MESWNIFWKRQQDTQKKLVREKIDSISEA